MVLLRKALLSAALCGLLTACGVQDSPQNGKVIGLNYKAPYTSVSEQCITYGKYGCKMWWPHDIHHEPRWRVNLQTYDQKGKKLSGWRDVDEKTFHDCLIGDTFDGGRCD